MVEKISMREIWGSAKLLQRLLGLAQKNNGPNKQAILKGFNEIRGYKELHPILGDILVLVMTSAYDRSSLRP